ncbi:hypothetical protein [Reichenbachiella versicolor]|uniref:hypothetical protein n=1 Tax=Reichenbachiella versicolor TaxID=1821036 RepID=UPI000D6E2843|nr:hypothetical protein [Reichenbachiella versicolor]
MSQSFEDKLREKLSSHQPMPPVSAKEKLFAKIPTSPAKPDRRWRIFALFLLGIFITIGSWMLIDGEKDHENTPVSKNKVDKSTSIAQSTPQVTTIEAIPNTPQISDASSIEQSVEEGPTSNMAISRVIEDVSQSNNEVGVESLDNVSEVVNSNNNRTQEPDKSRKSIEKVESIALENSLSGDETSALVFDNLTMTGKRKVKSRKSLNLKLYGDIGTFLLYQQIQPNLNDDLVIEGLEGEKGLSPKRLGFLGEVGVYKSVSEKVILNFGATFSMYNQHYSFNIRESQSTEAEASQSGSSVSLTPIFEEDRINIDRRLWVAGVKAGSSFYILPSKTNSIFFALEYGKILNDNQQFRFAEEDYSIHYTDQLLINIGLRKTLFELPSGDITIVPNLRYSLLNSSPTSQPISVKPFSAGLSISYLIGR